MSWSNHVKSELLVRVDFKDAATATQRGDYARLVSQSPYVKANGNPIRLYGLNKVGLQRNGVSEDVQRELKRAYRLFFNSDLNLSQARERAEEELQRYPEVAEFLSFLDRSDRGQVL